MTSTHPPSAEALRLRTVTWVVALATVGLIFDGHVLVIYGAVISTFLRDPSHIGNVTPATAGLLANSPTCASLMRFSASPGWQKRHANHSRF